MAFETFQKVFDCSLICFKLILLVMIIDVLCWKAQSVSCRNWLYLYLLIYGLYRLSICRFVILPTLFSSKIYVFLCRPNSNYSLFGALFSKNCYCWLNLKLTTHHHFFSYSVYYFMEQDKYRMRYVSSTAQCSSC